MNDLKLITVLFRTKNTVESAIINDLKRFDVNINTFAVLEQLYHKGSSKINEICEKLLIPNSSMTYLIDQLEKKQLVERQFSKEDRRSIYVDLTEKGRKLIESIFPEHEKLAKELFKVLTDEERINLLELLKKVSFSIEKWNIYL